MTNLKAQADSTTQRAPIRCIICGVMCSDILNGYCLKCGLAGKLPNYKIKVEGVKLDDDKNPLSLLPFEALDGVGLVLRHGAKKYDAHNWRNGMSWSRLISALLRHIFAFARGENIDPESGLPHLDHAACCILFLSSYQKTKNGTDDRFHVGEVK